MNEQMNCVFKLGLTVCIEHCEVFAARTCVCVCVWMCDNVERDEEKWKRKKGMSRFYRLKRTSKKKEKGGWELYSKGKKGNRKQ